MRVVQDGFGAPAEVLRVETEIPTRSLEDGELRVRIEAAPVLPMDHLRIRGFYPLAQECPGIPGSVGVGTVLEGPEVWQGHRVVIPMRSGAWATEVVVPSEGALRLAPDTDPVQAALLRVNGLTAQALVDGLDRGSWLIVNAATGGVGAYVLELARRMGVNVVALTRRQEAVGGLLAAGAKFALVDEPGWPKTLRQQLDEPIHRALDAVGGESTERLGRALSDHGRIVTYGALSRQAPRVAVADSVFRGVLLQGFWLYRHDTVRGPYETGRILNRMVELGIQGRVDSTWSLEDVQQALERDRSPERTGRVVFTPDVVWS